VNKVFVNRNNQVRSGWKIAFAFLFFYISGIIFNVLFGIVTLGSFIISQDSWKGFELDTLIEQYALYVGSNTLIYFISLASQSLLMIFAVFVTLKVFDRGRLRDFGLPGIKYNIGNMVLGLGTGAVSIFSVFIVLLASGRISMVEGILAPKIFPTLAIWLIIFVLVGLSEEFLFRGYCFKVLLQTGDRFLAAIISSIFFSLVHLQNPSVNLIAVINIFLAGLVFAYMLIVTGNLWMPIGFHITWNYFQGVILGFPVSGIVTESVYAVEITRNDLASGGRFGPEGGLVTTAVLTLLFIIILIYGRIRNRTVKRGVHI